MADRRKDEEGGSDDKPRAGRDTDDQRARHSTVELMIRIVKTLGRLLDDPDQ